jgi:FkbM family methyltransferase
MIEKETTDRKSSPTHPIYRGAQYLWRRFARGPHARYRHRKHLPLWNDNPNRRIVLIDAGAHEGQLFTECLTPNLRVKTNDIGGSSLGAPFFLVESLIGAKIHLFEPNPSHIPALERYRSQIGGADITVHNVCVWTENTTQKFYLSEGEWGDMGSTLFAEKSFPDERETIKPESGQVVNCIDLGEFIRKESTADDYVILKLDVEGAEFDILTALVEGGDLDKIQELHVEWHDNCFEDISALKARLLKEISKRNLYYVEWF